MFTCAIDPSTVKARYKHLAKKYNQSYEQSSTHTGCISNNRAICIMDDARNGIIMERLMGYQFDLETL